MSLERVFVICMNGSCRFVLSLLTALSFPSFFSVLSLPVFLSSSFACRLRKTKTLNVKRYNVRM